MKNEKSSDPWDPESSASFWINLASRSVLRMQEERLRPLGFGMSQMPVLHALENGESRSQKELTQWARVEQPTMALMLGRMERDGVVQREPNPKDGRGSLISLTRRSRARWPKAKTELIQGETDAMAGFSPDEKRQLVSLLQRVVGNLQK